MRRFIYAAVAFIFAMAAVVSPTAAYHNCAVKPGNLKVVEPGTEVVLWRGHDFEGFIYVHLQTDGGTGEGAFSIVDLASNQVIQTIAASDFATIGVSAPETGVEIRVKFETKTLCMACSKITDHKSAGEVDRQWSVPEVTKCGTDAACVAGILPEEHTQHDSVFWPS